MQNDVTIFFLLWQSLLMHRCFQFIWLLFAIPSYIFFNKTGNKCEIYHAVKLSPSIPKKKMNSPSKVSYPELFHKSLIESTFILKSISDQVHEKAKALR
jgi:hypothetical protein